MKIYIYIRYAFGVLGVLLVVFGLKVLFFSIPECGAEVMETPHTVVVGAFDIEIDAILQNIERTGECKKKGIVYYQGTANGIPLLVYESGMGLLSAEQTTNSTLSNFTVTQLVFSGIAGSVNTTLTVGSVVVAEEWVDIVNGEQFLINTSLVEKARSIELVQVVQRGASFDSFVTDAGAVPEGVHIVDMETVSIARSAEKYQVPFIAFRGISDVVGKESSDEIFHTAAQNSAEMAFVFLRK